MAVSSAERPHVDADVQQRPHQRLGLVRGHRAATGRGSGHQLAERGPHGVVGQQLGRQPGHVAGAGVGDDRQTLERGAPLAARPRGGDRERLARTAGPDLAEDAHGVGRRLEHGDLGLEHLGRRTPDAEVLAQRLGQPLGQAVELEEVEQAADLVDVGVLAVEVVDRDADRHVEDELHQLGVLPDARLVLGQVGPQLRGLLVEVLEDAVDAAVGGDELGRRLLAHARDAGQVVGRVAPQRGVLQVEAGVTPRCAPRCPPRRTSRSRTRRGGCRAP